MYANMYIFDHFYKRKMVVCLVHYPSSSSRKFHLLLLLLTHNIQALRTDLWLYPGLILSLGGTVHNTLASSITWLPIKMEPMHLGDPVTLVMHARLTLSSWWYLDDGVATYRVAQIVDCSIMVNMRVGSGWVDCYILWQLNLNTSKDYKVCKLSYYCDNSTV